MKTHRYISIFMAASVAAAALWFASCAKAGATNNATTNSVGTNSVSGTNEGPAELAVPVAVFDLYAKPTKDPFFPLSMRQAVAATNNPSAVFSVSEFTLKGLSGSTGNRLALVNNRTLAEGESAEVTTASGKVKIHCVEIKENSVLIRVASQREPVEIFLRKAVQ